MPESEMEQDATPVPYREGNSLLLRLIRNCCDTPFPETEPFTAIIIRRLDMTMSAVMDVVVRSRCGLRFRAVLKLYDRRFGTDLREIRSVQNHHTTADEEIFRSFVRQGNMPSFLQALEEEGMKLAPKSYWHYRDDTVDGIAKYEAALWRKCNRLFECETEAYERLADLQSKSIPRMFAHVRLAPESQVSPPDLEESQMAPYFEVRGVLLQLIPGYNLSNLTTSPLAPPDPETWPSIIQSAVDAAHDINVRGVFMDDCGPRNVVVDKRSQTPFIIDFADCTFRHKLVESWEERRETVLQLGLLISDDDEDGIDPNPEVEYWKIVECFDNCAAIGAVMSTKLLRQKGMELDVKYPDRAKIIRDIRAARKEETEKRTNTIDSTDTGNTAASKPGTLRGVAKPMRPMDDMAATSLFAKDAAPMKGAARLPGTLGDITNAPDVNHNLSGAAKPLGTMDGNLGKGR